MDPVQSEAEDRPRYDVFLSYASEDRAWCERLAERLRDDGIRVWVDFWELQPGDHLQARLNEGLERSRKLVALFSKSYFREDKHWTLAESYSTQHADVLARERPLIPVLIEDCTVKPTLRGLIHVDFRSPDDFEIRFRQLVQALDLPLRERREPDGDPFSFERDRGRAAHFRGKGFEGEVAALYRLLDYQVTQDTKIAGVQIDLRVRKVDGMTTEAIVECKRGRITAKERDQLIAQQAVVQSELPRCRWVAVSGEGFAADARVALEKVGFDCFTYQDLLGGLVRLDSYVEDLIAEHERRCLSARSPPGGQL